MAHHKQALKRYRQSERRRVHNRYYRRTLRTIVKDLETKAEDKKADGLAEALRDTTAYVARAAAKGIIPKRRASRKISRLMRNIKPQA